MTRNEKLEAKYKNTKYFKFYNANPKNKITCDCVIRALCTAFDKDYAQILDEMVTVQHKYGYMLNDNHTIQKYLKQCGFVKQNQPKKDDNTRLTGKEFCDYLEKHGNIGAVIANIGKEHIVCIKKDCSELQYGNTYKIFDTWDSSNRCIGNYWIKGE